MMINDFIRYFIVSLNTRSVISSGAVFDIAISFHFQFLIIFIFISMPYQTYKYFEAFILLYRIRQIGKLSDILLNMLKEHK